MKTVINDTPTFMTLSELAGLVKRSLESISGDMWVVAEISEINVNRYSGHCYLALVEKKNDATVAQMRATIWAGVYKRLISVFRKATGSELSKGMKVLMRGSISFHEIYGLSFGIREIDPKFTLGEMALKRRETLERLEKEGVIDLNRAIPLPVVPQRIAVIASETSAGYGDFIHRMTGNPYGYSFSIGLFSAYMQGDRAEASIINALTEVKKRRSDYDIAVIIRGGGSQVDLSCFDSYPLAVAVARFPLPVLTGIGHERDETVADRVSSRRLITPSAVAEFIVLSAREFEEALESLRQRLVIDSIDMLGFESHRLDMAGRGFVSATRGLIKEQNHRISTIAAGFSSAVRRSLQRASEKINALSGSMRGGLRLMFSVTIRRISEMCSRVERATLVVLERTAGKLETLEAKARLLDPQSVLSRGYSITIFGGRAVRDASEVERGKSIRTVLYDGEINSIVEDIKKEGKDA